MMTLFVAAILILAATTATTQESVFRPNENLVLEGIPAIPTSLVERVGRYTEFRPAIPLGWHPRRREMLSATGGGCRTPRPGATAPIPTFTGSTRPTRPAIILSQR